MLTNDKLLVAGTRRVLLGGAVAALAASTTAPSMAQAQARPSKTVWKYDESALVLIDYQPEMFKAVRSEPNPALIELNVRFLIKAARAFDIPIVLSTVGVKLGVNSPTFRSIAEELPGINEIDRSTMNAWEDPAFRSAVEKTGRKRLVFGALWTEICLVYPAISALEDGYEAMFVADAVGGTSQVAHDTGILRLVQAGAIPNTTRATIDEWFRDWSTPQAQKYRGISAWYRSELQPAADVAPNR